MYGTVMVRGRGDEVGLLRGGAVRGGEETSDPSLSAR